MREKYAYDSPQVDIRESNVDIITFSEEGQWLGPEIEAGFEPEIKNEN